jgi:hypothetical protein
LPPQEVPNIVERFFGGVQESDAGWENVGHALPGVDLDDPAFAFDTLAAAQRIVKEYFVFTHLNSNRRQSGQIAIQRRRPWVARVVPAEVESRRGSERVLS